MLNEMSTFDDDVLSSVNVWVIDVLLFCGNRSERPDFCIRKLCSFNFVSILHIRVSCFPSFFAFVVNLNVSRFKL